MPQVIEKGTIWKERILPTFRSFPWYEYRARVDAAAKRQLYFSTSLEFEHVRDQRGLVFSEIGDGDDLLFYVFYQRPERRIIYGREVVEPKYVSDILDQSFDAATEILSEFLDGDYERVRERFLWR